MLFRHRGLFTRSSLGPGCFHVLLTFFLAIQGIKPGETRAADATLAQRITTELVFEGPIEWAGEAAPNDKQSQELWRILQEVRVTRSPEPFEEFIRGNPQSPWAASLKTHLAKYYFDQGRVTRALGHWEAVWNESKTGPEGKLKALGDQALVLWGKTLSSLGRLETLEPLMAENFGAHQSEPA